MPIQRYADDVNEFRLKHPDCEYCISNKGYGIIGRVPECIALQKNC